MFLKWRSCINRVVLRALCSRVVLKIVLSFIESMRRFRLRSRTKWRSRANSATIIIGRYHITRSPLLSRWSRLAESMIRDAARNGWRRLKNRNYFFQKNHHTIIFFYHHPLKDQFSVIELLSCCCYYITPCVLYIIKKSLSFIHKPNLKECYCI